MNTSSPDIDALNGLLLQSIRKGRVETGDDGSGFGYRMTERGFAYARTLALAQGKDPDDLSEVELLSLACYGFIWVQQ